MKTDKDNLGCYCLKISKIAKRKVESFEHPLTTSPRSSPFIHYHSPYLINSDYYTLHRNKIGADSECMMYFIYTLLHTRGK